MNQYQKIASVYFIFVSFNINSSLPIVKYKTNPLPMALPPTQEKPTQSKISNIPTKAISKNKTDIDDTLQKLCKDFVNKLPNNSLKKKIFYTIKINSPEYQGQNRQDNKGTLTSVEISKEEQDAATRRLKKDDIDVINMIAFDFHLKEEAQKMLAFNILSTLNIAKAEVLYQESNRYDENTTIARFPLETKNENESLTFERLSALFLILNTILDTKRIEFDAQYKYIQPMAKTVLDFVQEKLNNDASLEEDHNNGGFSFVFQKVYNHGIPIVPIDAIKLLAYFISEDTKTAFNTFENSTSSNLITATECYLTYHKILYLKDGFYTIETATKEFLSNVLDNKAPESFLYKFITSNPKIYKEDLIIAYNCLLHLIFLEGYKIPDIFVLPENISYTEICAMFLYVLDSWKSKDKNNIFQKNDNFKADLATYENTKKKLQLFFKNKIIPNLTLLEMSNIEHLETSLIKKLEQNTKKIYLNKPDFTPEQINNMNILKRFLSMKPSVLTELNKDSIENTFFSYDMLHILSLLIVYIQKEIQNKNKDFPVIEQKDLLKSNNLLTFNEQPSTLNPSPANEQQLLITPSAQDSKILKNQMPFNNNSKKEIELLKEELTKKSNEIKNLNAKITQLEEQLKTTQTTHANLMTANSTRYEKQIAELIQKEKGASTKLQSKEATDKTIIENFESQLKDKDESIEKLNRELGEKKQIIETLENELKTKEMARQDLEDTLQQKNATISRSSFSFQSYFNPRSWLKWLKGN